MSLISRLSILQKLYLITAVFYVLPIWLLDYFPSLDGVSHVANGIIIKNLLLDENSFYHQFYKFNQYPAPNWLGHALAALFSLFLSPAANEKLIVSICILSFVGAYRYLVISINPRNEYLSYFSLIFALSGPLVCGAYNFCLSVSLFMVGFGFWYRNQDRMSLRNFTTFFLIFGFAYFSHIFGFGLLCLSIFVCFCVNALKKPKKDFYTYFISAAFLPFCASILFLCFFLYYLSADFQNPDIKFPYSMKFREFLFPTNFFLWDVRENIFGALVFLFIWILFLSELVNKFRLKEFAKSNCIVFLVLALVLAFFSIPNQFAGGWVIEPRINLAILIIASIYSSHSTKRAKNIIILLTLLLALSYNAYLQYNFYRMQNSLRDYYSVEEHIEKNSKLMSVDFMGYTLPLKDESKKLLGHYHLKFSSTNIATQRDSVEFFNYEPIEKNVFPLVFSDRKNTEKEFIKNLRSDSLANQIGKPWAIRKLFGTYPDFILVWYSDDLIHDTKTINAKNIFLDNIKYDYKLVFTSKLKLMHLYKRK